MTIVLIMAGVGVAGALIWLLAGPVGWRRAAPGLRYWVGPVEHTLPALRFGRRAPWMLKPATLAQMRVLLHYTHGLLGQENIPHWLTIGSLLGACRHGGFIPWDDDIDLQVPLEAWPRLLALRSRIERDGYELIPAAGGFKLASGNFRRYPYVDLIMVAPRDGRMALCFPLDRSGAPTFAKARQWPRECLRMEEVFPLGEMPFEDLRLPVPAGGAAAVQGMMGADALTEVRHRRGGHWVNHLAMMTCFRLGLSQG